MYGGDFFNCAVIIQFRYMNRISVCHMADGVFFIRTHFVGYSRIFAVKLSSVQTFERAVFINGGFQFFRGSYGCFSCKKSLARSGCVSCVRRKFSIGSIVDYFFGRQTCYLTYHLYLNSSHALPYTCRR